MLGAAERRAGRLGAAGYAFALCLAVLAAVGGGALLVKQPYLFRATTLIISLGLLTSTRELLAIAAGVLLVTVLGVALNRLLGVRQPLWR